METTFHINWTVACLGTPILYLSLFLTHIILLLIFFSNTTPPAEPCASTPAPNTVPPPASLSFGLPANSVFAPASYIAPPPELSPPAPLGSTSPQFPRRSICLHRQPAYLANLHTTTNIVSSRYPIHNYLSYNSLCSNFRNIISSINSHHEPLTYNKASKHAS